MLQFSSPSARIFCLSVALLTLVSAASAQQITPRLSDQEPFDRVTLNEENMGAVLKVELLELPGRTLPVKPPSESKLRLKLYAQPDKTYEVAWKHVAKVELFEQMLLEEAQQFVAKDKLNDAFDTLQYLQERFPKAPGLAEAQQSYLYVTAGRMFRQQHWPEAMAVLEELQRLNPDYRQSPTAPALSQVYGTVLQKIVEGYIGQTDYRAARLLLARIKNDYGDKHQATVQKWEQQLMTMAATELAAAKEFAAAGKLREANRACRRLNEIWPSLPGSAEVISEVATRYPIVLVGVTQPAKSLDPRRVDDWAAQRAGRLVRSPLIEFIRPGAEGGQYAFRFGSMQTSEDRRRLTLKLDANDDKSSPLITGYDLASRLLSMTQPSDSDFTPTWASLCGSVNVEDVMTVQIDLRHPYVVPEAVLQMSWGESSALFGTIPSEGKDASFVAQDRPSGSKLPAEITERVFDEQSVAISALRRGEIDIVDRIFPADVSRLESDETLVVAPYALPTLHFLLPTPGRPLSSNRTVRRAVLYALNREGILNEQMLGGKKMSGCQVISGPFSPGIIDNDPLAYAYDPQLQPRAYDPRLAAALIGLARKEFEVAEEKTEVKAPEMNLVLGHTSSETARVACQSIAASLAIVGLPCTLKALPPGETRDTKNECDFVYAEVTIGEPVLEARRLLAVDGAARLSDPYLALALRRLDDSSNWQEARERLKEIHRQVYADVSIIPLWQLVEHYAKRREFVGLEARPVSLYENIRAWQAPGTNTVAQTSP